ncbi:MAG: hypothetical protein KF878_37555 [Planctomycetes bacterium]|nr:hypothetical protein [Planctomycetota bacterium]
MSDAPRALVAAREVGRQVAWATAGAALGVALARLTLGPLEPEGPGGRPWVVAAAGPLGAVALWSLALLVCARVAGAERGRRRAAAFLLTLLLALAAGPFAAAAVEVLPAHAGRGDPFRAWPDLLRAARQEGRPGSPAVAVTLGAVVPLALVGGVVALRPRAPAWALVALAAAGGHLGLVAALKASDALDTWLVVGPLRHAALVAAPLAVAGLALARGRSGVGGARGWVVALVVVALGQQAHVSHVVHYVQDHHGWTHAPEPSPALRAVGARAVPTLLARAGDRGAWHVHRGVWQAVDARAALTLAAGDARVAAAVLELAVAAGPSGGREGLLNALCYGPDPVVGPLLVERMRHTDDPELDPELLRTLARCLVTWWVAHPDAPRDLDALAVGLLRALAAVGPDAATLEEVFFSADLDRFGLAELRGGRWDGRKFAVLREVIALRVRVAARAHPELEATAEAVLRHLSAR